MHLMVQYQAALRNNPNMSLRGSQNLVSTHGMLVHAVN